MRGRVVRDLAARAVELAAPDRVAHVRHLHARMRVIRIERVGVGGCRRGGRGGEQGDGERTQGYLCHDRAPRMDRGGAYGSEKRIARARLARVARDSTPHAPRCDERVAHELPAVVDLGGCGGRRLGDARKRACRAVAPRRCVSGRASRALIAETAPCRSEPHPIVNEAATTRETAMRYAFLIYESPEAFARRKDY